MAELMKTLWSDLLQDNKVRPYVFKTRLQRAIVETKKYCEEKSERELWTQIEELEEKKKVLTSSSQENERYVIQISELESQINDLKNEKRRLKYFIKKTKKSKENKEDDYSSIFKTYLSITKDKTYDKELERDNLRQWLNLTNQNFTDKLIKHYPVLSKSNQLMDVCCLTALNLSIEDIATLLGIGERTVERYTSDICKKVGLPKGGKHIFVEFINSIKELEA